MPEIDKNPERKRVSVSPDPVIWARFKRHAIDQRRPIARQLDLVLEEFLDRVDLAAVGD